MDYRVAADVAVRERLERAAAHAMHGRWDDAVEQLLAAEREAPANLEVLLALGMAYRGRWRTLGLRVDRQAAADIARRCIAIDPANHAAFKLLNEVDPPRQRSRAGLIIGVAVGASILAICFGGAITALRARAKPWSGETPRPVATYPQLTAASTVPPLPVTFEASPEIAGVTFQTRSSEMPTYVDTTWFQLSAELTNQTKVEIVDLELSISLFDDQGTLVTRENVRVAGSHLPQARPGDVVAFASSIRSTPNARRATVGVAKAHVEPAAEAYGAPTVVPIRWETKTADHYQLEVRERAMRSKDAFFEATFELHNKGGAAVRGLKYRVDLYDKSEKIISSSESYGVTNQEPSLRVGGTRLIKAINSHYGKGDMARYVVTITDIE